MHSALLCKALQAGSCHPKLHKVLRGCGTNVTFALLLATTSAALLTQVSAAQRICRWELLGRAWKSGLSFSVNLFNNNKVESSSGMLGISGNTFLVSLHQFMYVFPSVCTSLHHLFLAKTWLIMNKMSGPEMWLFPVDSVNFKCCWRNHLIFFLVYQCTYYSFLTNIIKT